MADFWSGPADSAAVTEQRAGGAPLSVAGSEAVRQRTAATGQLGRRSALVAGDGFCGGAGRFASISPTTPSLDPRLASVRRAENDVDRLAAAVHLRRSTKRVASLSASTASIRNHAGRWSFLRSARESGAALAAEAMCRELGVSSLLRVDLEALRASGENPGELISALLLQQRLQARDCILTRLEVPVRQRAQAATRVAPSGESS